MEDYIYFKWYPTSNPSIKKKKHVLSINALLVSNLKLGKLANRNISFGVQHHSALMEYRKINCKHEKNKKFLSTLIVELFSLLKDLFSYIFFSQIKDYLNPVCLYFSQQLSDLLIWCFCDDHMPTFVCPASHLNHSSL